jgi:hypothetical protein
MEVLSLIKCLIPAYYLLYPYERPGMHGDIRVVLSIPFWGINIRMKELK